MSAEKADPRRGAKRRLRFAIAIMIAWIGFLAAQTLLTANPPVLSRHQILSAPLIVEGNLADADSLLVTRVWRGDEGLVGKRLQMNRPLALPEGTLIIAPLVETEGGRYSPAQAPTGFRAGKPGKNDPTVYRANDASRRQLAELLAWREKQEQPADG